MNEPMFLTSVMFLAVIFILNLTFGMLYGFGFRHYWFPEFLHFLSGFFVAMFFASFFQSRLFILLGLAAVSLVWESIEYLMAKSPKAKAGFSRIFKRKEENYSLKDGTFDLILNFIGAAVFISFFK